VALVLGGAASAAPAFEPWAPLRDDNWILAPGQTLDLLLHSVNAGDFPVGFDRAGGGNSARGMNALKFVYGGEDVGHLESRRLADRFAVRNSGDARTFADLVLVVAIDAPALPAGFGLSLGAAGGAPYVFDRHADFVYYAHPEYDTGRPTGYYSITTPAGEDISYRFDRGMVTVFGARDVDLMPGGSVAFDYAFTGLPGAAVFSVYGLDTEIGWIYHTNRGVPDANRPSVAVSTFEVVPEPATLVLLALGVVLAARSGRR
jgi:hypothetical protein